MLMSIKKFGKLLILISLAIPVMAQVAVAPATIPHITFVDGAGQPCASCTLATYAAGTTTPLATYTDASGTSQNTNPIVLDAAGGANIWVGANSYKFILKTALGTTIWTVDQVNAGNLFPCSTPGAIQIANGAADGLTCDPTITINTSSHTVNVGTLPANHVNIAPLGTPTSWTFDTTTPATALASLGGGAIGSGTTNQIAIYPSTGNNVAGSSAIPNGITATTQAPTDNSGFIATTHYVAFPGALNPTSILLNGGITMTGNQGNGEKLQHSTGTVTSGTCAQFDSSGNTVSTPGPCAVVVTPRTCNSNGCYRVDGDGTITEWGVVAVSPTGTPYNSAAATFPFAFTGTPIVTVNTVGQAGSGDATTPPGVELQSASPTGFTAFMARVVIASAGGGNFDYTIYLNWSATGN
jgi:hypothetical protein